MNPTFLFTYNYANFHEHFSTIVYFLYMASYGYTSTDKILTLFIALTSTITFVLIWF